MVENYTLAKKIVSKKYNKDYPYYSMMVLSVCALLTKYSNYKEIVDKVFQETIMYIENDKVSDIIKKYQIEDAPEEDEEENDDEYNIITGISYPRDGYGIDDNGNLIHCQTSPYLICTTHHKNPVILLNSFVHEMSHLIKSFLDVRRRETKDLIYCNRSGLAYSQLKYDRKTDCLTQTDYYSILEEVINTVQTTEMMEMIKSLDGIIPDKEIQDYLDSLDKDSLTDDIGYNVPLETFKQLWKSDSFKELIEENIVEGNTDIVEEEFNSIVGENALDNLSDILEDLFYIVDLTETEEAEEELLIELRKKAEKIINKYIQSIKRYNKK